MGSIKKATIESQIKPVSAGDLENNKKVIQVYLLSLPSKDSKRVQLGALERIAGALTAGRIGAPLFPWHLLRAPHLMFLKGYLSNEGLSNRTVNRILSCARSIAGTAFMNGFMSFEDLAKLKMVKSIPIDTALTGRRLQAGEIAALFQACASSGDRRALRDSCMLALAYGCGMRRQEIAGAKLEDITFLDDSNSYIVVTGKGKHKRRLPLPAGTYHALVAYRESIERGDGYLFTNDKTGAPLTADTVYHVCLVRAGQANIKNFTPHDLRRSFASDLFDQRADAGEVRRLLGHRDLNNTQRYDLRSDRGLAAAVQRLCVPFRRAVEDFPIFKKKERR